MINLIKVKGINPITKAVIYFLRWTRISTVVETTLAKRMARGGTYSVGEAAGVLLDFPQFFMDELLNGNAVKVAGLGTFKLKVQGTVSTDPDKVTTRGAKASVVFEIDTDLAARLESETEFKLVTTPTSEGQQDADSNETPSTTTDTTDTQQGGTSEGNGGQQGGGSDGGTSGGNGSGDGGGDNGGSNLEP